MIKKKSIEIKKTARYFVLGESGKNLKYVWFVCHGYGQLANYFLQNFQLLDNGEHFMVAPEGLHRFYIEGLSGRVGASWMTKEDRETDIKDYVNFLNKLYNKVTADIDRQNVKIIVLGFSQGTHTACRWLCDGSSKADHLILWGGGIPDDIDPVREAPVLQKSNLKLVLGNQDQYITTDRSRAMEEKLSKLKIDYKKIIYKGKHKIEEKGLKQLLSLLIK